MLREAEKGSLELLVSFRAVMGARDVTTTFEESSLLRSLVSDRAAGLLREHLQVEKLLERILLERSGQVVEEVILRLQEGLEQSAQVLVNNLGRRLDPSQVVL